MGPAPRQAAQAEILRPQWKSGTKENSSDQRSAVAECAVITIESELCRSCGAALRRRSARPGPPVPRSPGAGGAKAPQVILKPDYT